MFMTASLYCTNFCCKKAEKRMKTLETCALIVTTKTFHVKMEEETPVTYFFVWIFWCMTSDEHVYSRWVIFKKDSLVPKASLELWQLHNFFRIKAW
jgi:hypothetical protein